MKRITYKPTTLEVSSMGRNGFAKTVGLDLYVNNGTVLTIQPVTGKGNAQNCIIQIPMDDVGSLIEALKEVSK